MLLSATSCLRARPPLTTTDDRNRLVEDAEASSTVGSSDVWSTHESAWKFRIGQQTWSHPRLKKSHEVPPGRQGQTLRYWKRFIIRSPQTQLPILSPSKLFQLVRLRFLAVARLITSFFFQIASIPTGVLVICFLILWNFAPSTWAGGPLIDPLDGQPLKWRLVDADGPAEVRQQWLDADGGMERRPCEAMTMVVGHCTRVELEYRIPPARVIEDVRATVAVKSIRQGPRIGLRLRFPRTFDPATRSPKSVVIWGETHGGRDRWEMLSVSPSADQQQNAEMALRSQFGPTVDLRDSYIEAVVLNAFAGAGAYTIRLDELRVDGLTTIDVNARSAALRNSSAHSMQDGVSNAEIRSGFSPSSPYDRSFNNQPASNFSAVQSAFPAGRITRVIEYNGESLQYLKLLGFDAILLSRPPTVELLSQAVEHSVMVYSPPPQSRDFAIEPLLQAIAGWYLGTSTDERQLQLAASDQQRLASFGTLWQKPFIIAPAEAWDRYAGIATSMVYDMPPYVRGLSGGEEIDLLVDHMRRTGRPVVASIGVGSIPSARLSNQIDALGGTLGAVSVEDYGWRWIWLQAIRGLTIAPKAIIFRSSRSLEDGTELNSRRSAAMGFVNHWLGVIGPLITASRFRGTLVSSRDDYKLAHLSSEAAELVIATHNYNPASPNPNVFRFGADKQQDSDALVVRVPVGANNFAWRLTHTSVEQLRILGDSVNREIVIDNPDLVEWIVTSNDPGFGGSIDRYLRNSGDAINRYRWDLVSQSLLRTHQDWRSAAGGGLVNRQAVPNELLKSAAQMLSSVQSQIASRNFGAAMRTTKAVDLMTLRCEAMLAGRLMPAGTVPQSLPTQLAPGGVPLQLAWMPSLHDGRWSGNLLAGGELEDSETLVRTGWTYQTRLADQATAAVGVEEFAGENGAGALRIEASGKGARPLAGGYAGTVARVNSSPITFEPGTWVRIQARVRTLGFGNPNQGLLVYDSEAGSEIGVLVRGNSPWSTLTIYRIITSSNPLRVTFEGIGGGEAAVDWVTVSMWQPPLAEPQFRPIDANASLPIDTSFPRSPAILNR